MDWINKIINSKSKVKKSDAEQEYKYEALFGEKVADSSTNNFENAIKVNLDADAEPSSKVENELGDGPVSIAQSDSGEISENEDAPEDRTFELTEKEIEDIVSVISNEGIAKDVEKVDGIEIVGFHQPEIEKDDFPEYENLDEVVVDPSSGFEEEPFVSNDLENLENEIGEDPNSLERWMLMGDALNDGIIDVDDRPFSPDDFEPEVSRFGSAIRWTDGLANPILWTIENDWTQRELTTIKNFVGKVAVAVRNRGVLLDSDNIMMMAETISAENVGRTMFMLSEPWMSRTKLNSSDAMNLAGKLAPKICDSLKFETLSSVGLSEAFAKTRGEFEDKLGKSTRSEIQHVVQIIRSLKTPLAYTMATSLDYVCACLGDRAAMVRISDAIQTLLDDDMIEPEAVMLDMAHVADNWRRLAHAQYLGSDNSFEAFEQRFAIETIDLSGKKGKIDFDSRVVLSEPSNDLLELCIELSARHSLCADPVDTKQNVKETRVVAKDISKAAEDLSPSDQEFFDQIAKEYSDSGSVSISMEPDLILTDTGGDGTRIRVLDRIAGSDGNSSAERNYGHLLRPLPVLPAPDPDKLYSELMAEFPWMAEINEEVARAAALSTRHIGKCYTIPPMLLNGPSGVGKTRWVRRVAQLSSVPIHFISVAGSDSSKSIMGSERGWSNARPSLPVMALSSTQVVNPIIMVDELDKANASTNGDPFAALLPMLSTETNTTYPDAYLLGSVNLSYASFIFTANSISKLGTPLLDRIDVFNVIPPSPKDYPAILQGMIAEAARNACINESETNDIMERQMGYGMDCLARGDSLRKVERAINDAIAKYIWKPKSHLTLVK